MLGTWLIKWGCSSAAKRRNRNFTGKGVCLYDITYGPSLAADVWRPREHRDSPRPTIFYVHGGGFVAGDKSDFDAYCEHLCAEGYTVINLNYTLAPKAVHPQPVEEILTAISFFTEKAELYGVNPNRLVVSGDSAGAFLALAAGTAIVNREYLPHLQDQISFDRGGLKAMALFCGAFSLQTALSSGFPFLREYISSYAGVKDVLRYLRSEQYFRADPNNYLTSGFPRTFLAVGSGDYFLEESKGLAARLRGVGAEVSLYVDPDPKARHEFHGYLESPAAKLCSKETFAFLKSTVGEST